jgi:hypothetical protein
MPIEMTVRTEEVIDLDEFKKRVLAKVKPDDPASLALIAHDIVALANNRTLLIDRITSDIASWRSHRFAMYSAQSCILDRFGPFMVRINLWPAGISTPGEKDALSYNAYHDHNFSFATTNFYGPGYRTDLFELNDQECRREVGDVVRMTSVGEWRLGKGCVVVYRKGVDMHAQIPPDKDSASLNLIISEDDVLFGDQFYYDPATSRVVGMVENVVGKRMSLVELGRYIAGPESALALKRFVAGVRCQRSAEIAAQILSEQ